jgi:ribonuclease P protein component
LIDAADFERVLGAPPCRRSVHFAVHHLDAAPAKPRIGRGIEELSTMPVMTPAASVDESLRPAPPDALARPSLWLGIVVAKRHARRSVTRSLLKREMRAGFARQTDRLVRGMWVVRLRAPFDPKRFPSAASSALRSAARAELETLLAGVVQTQNTG